MSHRLHRAALVRACLALVALGAVTVVVLSSLGGGAAAADRPARASHAATHRATAAHPGRPHARVHKASTSDCWNPAANPRTCTLSASETMPTVAPLTAADGARLARTGSIQIPIHVGAPGTITAVGDAPIGNETIAVSGTAPDGSTRAIRVRKDSERITEPASVTATRPGTVHLTVALTAAAKARLAAGKHLELFLRIRSSNSPAALTMFVPLAAA